MINETYQKMVIEELFLKYLKEGTIPTSDDIERDLAEYLEKYIDFDNPQSSFVKTDVDYGSSASVSKLQDIVRALSFDLKVLSREIYSLMTRNSILYEKWIREINLLESKSRKVDNEINSLLLLTGDTAGYFNVITDNFADISKVDTSATTSLVDLGFGVTLNPGFSTVRQSSKIRLDREETSVSFNILTKKSNNFHRIDELDNVLKESDSRWTGYVSSPVKGQMLAELKVRLGDSGYKLTRVAMNYTGPVSSGNANVVLLYSVDGYTWNTVQNSAKTLSKKVTWLLDKEDVAWVKFVFDKPSHDSSDGSNYYYEYSISSLEFYGDSYSQDIGNLFQSSSLSAKKADESIQSFSSVLLEVCEDLPKDTSIDYWVSASKNNQSWTNWHRISPKDTESIKYPKIVGFENTTLTDNMKDSTELLNSSLGQNNITTSTSRSDVEWLSLKTGFGLINTAIIVDEDSDPDLIANSISVFRNVSNSEMKVRNGIQGWGRDNDVYYCTFEVINKSGVVIDFGNTTCAINGEKVTGVKDIKKGIYKFSTSAQNWKQVEKNLNNEEEFEDADPLYPYNHKLLIEGYSYPDGFKGSKPYKGTNLVAEFYGTRTSLFDLQNSKNLNKDLHRFAVKDIGKDSNILGVVVKYNPAITSSNEEFLVRYRNKGEFKYIKLKAELKSASSSKTPVLESYRLKLS